MWMATIVEEDGVSKVPLNGSPCGWQEDREGMPSESSHIVIECVCITIDLNVAKIRSRVSEYCTVKSGVLK